MYLYGASGHAKVVIDILKALGEQIEGLVDDNPDINKLMGIPVIHDCIDLSPMIVSIGVNANRKKIVNKLNCDFGSAIHPSALVAGTARIDEGTVVMQGTIVQVDTQIGKHCIINTGASVDHECRIEDFVHLSPHVTLCGNVTVGEGSWIGAGSVVLPGVKIGKWSVIGAGSIVSQNIRDGVLAVGNRCKIIKNLNVIS